MDNFLNKDVYGESRMLMILIIMSLIFIGFFASLLSSSYKYFFVQDNFEYIIYSPLGCHHYVLCDDNNQNCSITLRVCDRNPDYDYRFYTSFPKTQKIKEDVYSSKQVELKIVRGTHDLVQIKTPQMTYVNLENRIKPFNIYGSLIASLVSGLFSFWAIRYLLNAKKEKKYRLQKNEDDEGPVFFFT